MMLPLLLSAFILAHPNAPSTDTARVARTASTSRIASPSDVPVADSIVVEKGVRKLSLFYKGVPVRTYGVALGRNPNGDKVSKGDGRTPEGVFRIESRNSNSKYHLALRISYPDVVHQMRSEALGMTAGGDIMIHGLPKGYEQAGAAHRDNNWTEGCVAVTNEEIEEIWKLVKDGTPIEIKP